MNSRCDPDDPREPGASIENGRALWQARWFRATVVFSIAGVMAAFVVPCAVSREAREELARPRPVPRARSVGTIPEVTMLVWEGHPIVVGVSARPRAQPEHTAAGGPATQRVSASGSVVPKSPGSKPTKEPKAVPSSKAPEAAVTSRAGDMYWVQVGAFRDIKTAQRVAHRLREQKYPVQESVTTRQTPASERAAGGPGAPAQGERDRYEVVVTGGSASEVEAKLTAMGLTSRAAAEGAVITPGLPLGEAVALSKDLSNDGLGVRVRRVGVTAAAPPRSQGSDGSEALHRVRVGGFTDRAAAEAAMKELESRGYEPVLTRGTE